jgi:myosin-3
MYDGLEADGRLEEFHLNTELRKSHRYLSDNPNTSQTHIDKFKQLKVGFKVLGFHDAEVDTVYSILAAIIHLGDIEFTEIASDDNTDNKSGVVVNEPILRGNSSLIFK